jgi:hypothetical protein
MILSLKQRTKQKIKKTIKRKKRQRGGLESYEKDCEANYKTIQEKLEKKGIESFSSSEESDEALKFVSHEYDKIAKRVEKAKTATVMLDVFGLGFAPLAQVSIVSKVAVYGISKYEKSKQVSYISSQCLSFLSNISRDLAEINAFYSCSTIKQQTNIRMDTTLYDILNKNLFTFLYFLIDSIDFTLTKLGAYQYLFWHTFLVKLDFNKANFDKPIPMSVYRYSCEECIPITLRKKLQELSKQPFKPSFKSYINFDNVDKTVTDLKIRTGYIWKKDDTTKSVVNQYGFCGARQLALCKNHNDTIVRLIEFNIYKLIDTTYKHRDQLDINNKHIEARNQLDINNKHIEAKGKITTFLEAVFSRSAKLISKEEKTSFEKTFKTEFRTKLQNSNPIIPDSKKQIIAVSICFEFLIELNRLISELDYIGFIGLSKAPNNMLSNTLSKFAGASFTFFGSPVETYNILMREYTMMTGNFGMMSTRYALDYNGLTNVQKEIVSNEVNTVLKKVGTSLDFIGDDLKNTATKISEKSKLLPDDQTGDGDKSKPSEPTVVGGKQKYFKKNKYSKKLKIKRN